MTQQKTDHIDELTVTPQDVYVGTGLSGEITDVGNCLSRQNPELFAILVEHAQHDLHQKFPYLYPSVPRPRDVPASLRRTSSAPAATTTRPRLDDREITRLFGPGGNAGECNRLAMLNPTLYAESRARAQELGYVSANTSGFNRSHAVRGGVSTSHPALRSK